MPEKNESESPPMSVENGSNALEVLASDVEKCKEEITEEIRTDYSGVFESMTYLARIADIDSKRDVVLKFTDDTRKYCEIFGKRTKEMDDYINRKDYAKAVVTANMLIALIQSQLDLELEVSLICNKAEGVLMSVLLSKNEGPIKVTQDQVSGIIRTGGALSRQMQLNYDLLSSLTNVRDDLIMIYETREESMASEEK